MGEHFTRRRARWESDEILALIREWAERYGSPPSSMDWNPTLARRLAAKFAARARYWARAVQRFEADEWPWQATVVRQFGTWNRAIELAGFEPRRSTRLEAAVQPLDLDALNRLTTIVVQALDEERFNSCATTLYELADRAVAWAEELTWEEEQR